MYEYGVLRRVRGSNDDWLPVTGYRKTTDSYRTLTPAKVFKTKLENQNKNDYFEYRLVRRIISEWEDVV